eukprot:s171_g9.t2
MPGPLESFGLNKREQQALNLSYVALQEKPPTVEELPAAWKDRMKIVKELGSGAFGRIYQLAATCDGTKDHFVSMKFMVKDSDAFREVKALRRVLSAQRRDGTNMLGQDWRSGLVHMDIKLENIMITCVAEKCSAHIIDLGVSAAFGTRMPSGTPGYMAPEVLKIFGSSQPQNDIFSLGVVLYMFVYGQQLPFFRDGNTRNYDPTKDTVIPQSDNAEQSEIDRLVISMLNNDYKSRIDTPEILQRLMGALLTLPDLTPEVIEMFSLTHVDEGDGDLPQCLWDWAPPAHDLADGPFHRDDCLEPSTERKQPPQKMKLCECHVLRDSKRVLESFKAPECL